MARPTPADRIRGCLVGGAVGDALGADVEFDGIGQIRARYGPAGVTGYVAPDSLGRITDDTQMTLFTAEGLIRAHNRANDRGGGNVTAVVHRAYLRWLLTQDGDRRAVPWDELGREEPSGWLVERRELHVRRAPGMTCLDALRGGTPGSRDEPINDSKGCGGVMRVAPVGLVMGDDAFSLAVDAAALTHTHPTGYLTAGAFADVISGLVHGDDLATAVERTRRRLETERDSTETIVAIDAALAHVRAEPDPTPENVERLGRGWVAEEALAIALYCALTGRSFRDAVLAAVNHSGDSDSTGSMCGNLVGTALGIAAVPGEWIDGLAERSIVDRVADDVIEHFVDERALHDVDRYPTW